MRRERFIKTAAVVISAIATGLVVSYFLPSALEFVSLVPFLLVLFSAADGERPIRREMRLGFLYFYAYYLVIWHWFLLMYPLEFTGVSRGGALIAVVVAWLGLPLVQTVAAMLQIPLFLYMAHSPLLSRDGKLRVSAPAVYGLIYIFFEWVQTLTWAGVPWGRLAIGQSYVPSMIGSASLFGSYFVSFVIVAVNGYIAFSISTFMARNRRRAAALAGAAVLILSANVTYGAVRIYIKENKSKSADGILTVAVLQGNVSSTDKWKDDSDENLLMIYSALTYEASSRGSDIVVFPETAIPVTVNGSGERGTSVRGALEDLSESSGVTLLATGFWHEDSSYYNSVFAVSPDEGLGESAYYKRHLVPFGEFVPYEDVIRVLVPPLAELGLFDGSISTGNDGTLLETSFGQVGAMVCFDSIYETSSLDEVRAGAELLTVSTNDSWFDGSAAIRQHTAQSVLRAVECDRYVCRAGNTGFSCIISPIGQIVTSVEPETLGLALCNVEMRETRTLYSYIGNSFAYAAGIFSALCVVSAIIDNRMGKRQEERRARGKADGAEQ